MAKDTKDLVFPPPLQPMARSDLLKERKLKMERTINDYAEDVYLELSDDETFTKLTSAVHDSQAVHGSLSMDNAMAALAIQVKAKAMGSPLAEENLQTIKLALGVVLRRYGRDRKQRRNMIHGEEMPSSDKDNGE